MTKKSVIVLDTCVLINLSNAGRLDILGKILNIEFLTTEHVIQEITDETQKEKVLHCIKTNLIRVFNLTLPNVIEDYLNLNKRHSKHLPEVD